MEEEVGLVGAFDAVGVKRPLNVDITGALSLF